MPPIESGMVPMTKQLNSVTVRPVPEPAMIRPAGRNSKFSKASAKRSSHVAGSRSGAASAFATRRQVSAMALSTGAPLASLRRYFMSQICWETAATEVIGGSLEALARDHLWTNCRVRRPPARPQRRPREGGRIS
jgi:hypothetical protein